MSSLGKRIRKIRNLRGLTQEKLAEKCSVSSACVSRWETGNLIPTRAHQEKIAMALEIQLVICILRPRSNFLRISS